MNVYAKRIISIEKKNFMMYTWNKNDLMTIMLRWMKKCYTQMNNNSLIKFMLRWMIYDMHIWYTHILQTNNTQIYMKHIKLSTLKEE